MIETFLHLSSNKRVGFLDVLYISLVNPVRNCINPGAELVRINPGPELRGPELWLKKCSTTGLSLKPLSFDFLLGNRVALLENLSVRLCVLINQCM